MTQVVARSPNLHHTAFAVSKKKSAFGQLSAGKGRLFFARFLPCDEKVTTLTNEMRIGQETFFVMCSQKFRNADLPRARLLLM